MNRPRLKRPAITGTAAADAPSQSGIESPPILVAAVLTAEDMNDALEAGHAIHLSALITDFVRHQNHWWLAHADTWLRVDDVELADLLTTQHQRFSRT